MNTPELTQLRACLDEVRIQLHLMFSAGADTDCVESLVDKAIEMVDRHLRDAKGAI